MRILSSFSLLLLLPAVGLAQANAIVPDPDPEIERKSFIVAPGFEVSLFAADPLLAKPLQINFDPAGRLWVSSSEVYPQIKPGDKANDKILILEDTDGDGKADKTTIFADGLLIPTGVEPGDGGAYVANSTELVHLSASKPGQKADRTRVLLSGFGTEDTHHIVHTFRWGPDQSLYFNQSIYIHSHLETPHGVKRLNGGGVWRFRPETTELEVFVRGFVNTWGHHFDKYGQSFMTDGAYGEGVNHGVPGAYYVTAVGATRLLNGMNPGSPKHCGLEVLSGRHLPDDWQGNVITHDFRGHRVCRFVLRDAASSYESREMTEVIKTNHPAFRPIDVKMGPDGAIYVADWYNPIIQHGEVDFRDPRRDHTHGRIWRITAKDRPLVAKPKLVDASVAELLEQLKAPEGWTREKAKRVLKERGKDAVLPELAKWVAALPPDAEHARLEAAWVRQSFADVDMDTLSPLLAAKEPHVRAAAVRMLSDSFMGLNKPGEWTKALQDEHPQVRMEAVRAVAAWKTPEALELALGVLKLPMDPVLDYALWLTVRDLEPYWLTAFKDGTLSLGGDARAIAFALNAVGTKDVAQPLLKLAKDANIPAERRKALWLMLAKVGGPNEVGDILGNGFTGADGPTKLELLQNLEANVRRPSFGKAPALDTKTLTELSQENDTPQAQAALRLLGLLKQDAARATLEQQAVADKRPAADRAAALEGLVHLGGPKSRQFFDLQAAKEQPILTRRLAVQALTMLDLTAAAATAGDVLSASDAKDDLGGFFDSFLLRKGGPAALAKGLTGKTIPADVAKVGLRAIRSSSQNVPDLVAALTKAGNLAAAKKEPTADEVKAYVADVLKTGDATRGEAVFRRKEMQCLACHGIAGVGGQVGPDMTSIGASAQPDYLVESLLIPNKAIKEGYHAIEVNTLSGKVVSGIKLRETKTELALRNAEDKEVSISTDDIDTKKQTRSLMPDGLVDTLTRQELVDLVRFLSELGKVGPYAPNPARLVRRWQYLDPTGPATNVFRRERVTAAVEKPSQFTWVSAYTRVSGDLPTADVPSFVVWNGSDPLTVVRFELKASVEGAAALKWNSVEGLSVYVGEKSVEAKPETAIDVKTGTTVITVVVDRSKRKSELRCELVDVPNSPARVAVVGGK
ncbi:PVC-type heme-binding CxxCH protein [Limnoglobus roseus]|uniref:Putative beta-propeller-type glycoside hydrolase n=1 Tax=Limnoglobus roseus TaxID=2598579 RepID=A0A5C1AM35_9BACT|nr:PVC-type heme-binding CxxCH protein [Limnoglobus roseus]QEL18792.1 putative beta-propeller-type glycoside hydrolase [Limnoglobus roseus]